MLNARDYGVMGDGVTDDTLALNALKTAFPGLPVTFKIPDGDYLVSDNVIFDTGIISLTFDGGAQLVYSGPADRPALVIGNPSLSTTRRTFDGLAVVTSGNSFSNENSVGIRIIRCLGCDFYARYVSGFTINQQLYGSGVGGIAYNTFKLGISNASKVHLNFTSTSNFINENKFFGGDFESTSAYGASLDCYGIRFDTGAGGYTGHNQNVFYSPCFQLADGSPGTTRIPVWFNNTGVFNTIHEARVESGRGEVVRVTSNAVAVHDNKVTLGYFGGANLTALLSETDGGLAYGNVVVSRPTGETPLTWDSGDLLKKSCAVTATTVATKGLFYQLSSSAIEAYSGAAKIGKDWLIIHSHAPGVYVDTSYYKVFELNVGAKPDRLGRIAIVAYDANGNILTNAGPGHPYIVAPFLAGAAAYGYRYATQSDATRMLKFSVGSAVAKIKILFAPGTNPMYLRSFQIKTWNTGGLTSLGLSVCGGPYAVDGAFLTTASPATNRGGGYVTRGEVFYNASAAAAVTSYWQCSVSGINAKAWVANTPYVVNEMAERDSGKVYVCTLAGTSGVIGPVGIGSAITDGSVTWAYTGSQLPSFVVGPKNA